MIFGFREFFKPEKKLRVLSILEALRQDGSVSQYKLGCATGLSNAMINQYLRDMQTQELVEFQPRDGKSFKYTLTQKGEDERLRLFSMYCAELVRIYTGIKELVRERLTALAEEGITRIAMYGASETCEVALSALADNGFQVLALVDSDSEKHGQGFHGHVISPPQILKTIDCQAVIITSFGRKKEIMRSIRDMNISDDLRLITL